MLSDKDKKALTMIAMRFHRLLRLQGGETVDLNTAVRDLDTTKRRLYDVTNVMEGEAVALLLLLLSLLLLPFHTHAVASSVHVCLFVRAGACACKGIGMIEKQGKNKVLLKVGASYSRESIDAIKVGCARVPSCVMQRVCAAGPHTRDTHMAFVRVEC